MVGRHRVVGDVERVLGECALVASGIAGVKGVEVDLSAHRRPGHVVTGHDLTGECTERAANLVEE